MFIGDDDLTASMTGYASGAENLEPENAWEAVRQNHGVQYFIKLTPAWVFVKKAEDARRMNDEIARIRIDEKNPA